MVAQEDRPLGERRDFRRLLHDLHHRVAVLLRDRHVHARHQREVERHVALVALAEVRAHVLGPLIRLGEQHPVLVARVHVRADLLQHEMRFRQVLVVRSLALAEIRNGIQPEAVDAHVRPRLQDLQHRAHDMRIVEVEVRLMAEEAVPVVLLRHRIPRPVRGLGVGEDDARALVLLVAVAPHVVVALARALRRAPRRLEPGVLVGGVVDHELGDHLEPAAMRLGHEGAEVLARPVVRMHVAVIGDVVAVVLERRRIERQQPHRVDAELLDVVELGGEAGEVADAVAVRVEERLDVQLVDDRVLVPERGVRQRGLRLGDGDELVIFA